MTGPIDPRRRLVGSDTTPVVPPSRETDQGVQHGARPSPEAGTPLDPDLEQAVIKLRHRVPTAVKVLTGVVGCITALCVAIWAMGGFATRTDLDEVAPGQQFSVGPVGFTLDRVEISTLGSSTKWYARGTCRYELDSASPSWQTGVGDAAFLGVRDPDTKELFTSTNSPTLIFTEAKPHGSRTSRREIAPGIDAVGCVFDFPMPESTPTNPTQATVLLYDLQLADAHATSGDSDFSKAWRMAPSGHRVELPVVTV